jgi:hypothetical protein
MLCHCTQVLGNKWQDIVLLFSEASEDPWRVGRNESYDQICGEIHTLIYSLILMPPHHNRSLIHPWETNTAAMTPVSRSKTLMQSIDSVWAWILLEVHGISIVQFPKMECLWDIVACMQDVINQIRYSWTRSRCVLHCRKDIMHALEELEVSVWIWTEQKQP